MQEKKVRFARAGKEAFYPTMKKRVNQYFKNNRISRYGNMGMVVKSIFMFSLYTAPFVLMMTGLVSSTLPLLLMWVLMGFGLAGIGMSVAHDANHGAISRHGIVNRLMGYSLNLLGGNAMIWKLQHNVGHHTFTNIEGMDKDINGPPFLRFSPHQTLRKIHRFQHIYVWFFYTLMTLSWVTWGDFSQLLRHRRNGTMTPKAFREGLLQVIAWKVVYYGYIMVLPMLLLSVSPLMLVLGFVFMHMVAGFILSIIFQTAHVMTDATFPLPDEDGKMDNSWAVHQVVTTGNYSPRSRIFSWYIGGLNYQIEHHLFANISHIHYPRIARIVRDTAREFGIPYSTHRTFLAALRDHARMLKQLGRAEAVA